MSSATRDSTAKAILYAFLANAGIALAKTWAASITGSGSMLAEAIHSYADTGNQVLLFVGLKQSIRPADEKHPLGYGKLSYFWSFIVAIMLFSVGGLFSVYEGLHKLQNPEPLSQIWIALMVLGIAIVLESFSLLGCLKEIGHIRGDRPFFEWLKNTSNSALVVVLGEDVAALLGLLLATGFLTTAGITGNPIYDAVGSMSIGAILIIISAFLSLRVRALLVGQSADPAIQQKIAAVLADDPDVEHVYNIITVQLGPDTMLAAKIRLNPKISLEAAVKIINSLEKRLKIAVPELKWSFVEPDFDD